MRHDAAGLFWDDSRFYAPRKPPEPLWLRDDYLPSLDEARACQFDLMTDAELIAAQVSRETLIWDIEAYPNYFLLGFRSHQSGKILIFEMERGGQLDLQKLEWVLTNFTLVGFNSIAFDLPIATAALAGFPTDKLMACVLELIEEELRPQDFYKRHKLEPPSVDQIDLIELTPLAPSLKVAAGRLHAPRMQDLPFLPGKELTPDQITILRWYWTNDLVNTDLLYQKHKPAIELRTVMTAEYGVDVRSKSDPQIAEQVIRAEIKRIQGGHIKRAEIKPGRKFKYQPPNYLQYQSATMQWVLDFVKRQEFIVDDKGGPHMSKELEELVVTIGETKYSLGIGGLHSQEKRTIHVSDNDFELTDNDVTSYYPSLIIDQGMYPPNIGPVFLKVFKRIYKRRLEAKATGDKATAETLKIVLNGTFGKTGERGGFSVVYYPEMMIQVTVTGQLALLMLIEQLELASIPVVSANTDGIIIKCPRNLIACKQEIIANWERTTGLAMESTPYKSIYSRDVNNYLAFYNDPQKGKWAKAKGAYAFASESGLKKNPTCEICTEAVVLHIATGVPIEQTIYECQDIRKFVEVRLVRGGACKNGEYLGKAIRWYYSKDVHNELINAKNGHFVPNSTGAKPCMELPDSIPNDLDHDYYIKRSYGIMDDFKPEKK